MAEHMHTTRRPSRLRKLWHIVVGVGLLWSGTWLSVVLFIEQSIEQNTEQTHAPQELAHVAQASERPHLTRS